jgi:hypothetical protein
MLSRELLLLPVDRSRSRYSIHFGCHFKNLIFSPFPLVQVRILVSHHHNIIISPLLYNMWELVGGKRCHKWLHHRSLDDVEWRSSRRRDSCDIDIDVMERSVNGNS